MLRLMKRKKKKSLANSFGIRERKKKTLRDVLFMDDRRPLAGNDTTRIYKLLTYHTFFPPALSGTLIRRGSRLKPH